MSVHLFGIRHHGPGSARSLRHALEKLQPDCVLIEGPPDAQSYLPLALDPGMTPPVAILIYVSGQPQIAVYYPFACFSPEWQALHYALSTGIPVRFIDLPQAYRLATEKPEDSSLPDNVTSSPSREGLVDPFDPLDWLGKASGYGDGERWWEHMVEQRQDSQDLFVAIQEVMTSLRAAAPESLDPWEARREAYMRQRIREAEAQHSEIAVVCGAWHIPALVNRLGKKQDQDLLKSLPKVKIETTWIPWTYGRLTYTSGYGAGIHSPGWYEHLWTYPQQGSVQWLTRVARLLREQDLDASVASVIEAVRLAESLTALRQWSRPGLEELNEAAQTVLCFGDPLPMHLIHQQLVVGECLGEVPASTPMVPLQQDLLQQQKKLRLKPKAQEQSLELDLRQELDRGRSCLLHRLSLLSIPWGIPKPVSSKGTFKELWELRWRPEFAVALIEAGVWGTTIETACTAYMIHQMQQADLPDLTQSLEKALLADLGAAVPLLMQRLQAVAALSHDIQALMRALDPLVQILRYTDVRQTDIYLLNHIIDGLIARICIGLPVACRSLNDEAAKLMEADLSRVHQAISLLNHPDHQQSWQAVLRHLGQQANLHGLVAGRCCRLLLDQGIWSGEEVARRLSYALSLAMDPLQAGAWIEGLLKGSGLVLLHHDTLWQVLDKWVVGLSAEAFVTLLPLLRRTFARFSAPERRQMGEKVKQGQTLWVLSSTGEDRDDERVRAMLPFVKMLLGLDGSD
jgi:hypothetical protein